MMMRAVHLSVAATLTFALAACGGATTSPSSSSGGASGGGAPGAAGSGTDANGGSAGASSGGADAGCASGAGRDAGPGCGLPPGTIACDNSFCKVGTEYCETTIFDDVECSVCKPLPAACGGVASCACVETLYADPMALDGCTDRGGVSIAVFTADLTCN
jgi:hypothetical protein